jgi:hypothetical protein
MNLLFQTIPRRPASKSTSSQHLYEARPRKDRRRLI